MAAHSGGWDGSLQSEKHTIDKAKKSLDQLNVVYNFARKAQITDDLLEIMAAAEALREEHFS